MADRQAGGQVVVNSWWLNLVFHYLGGFGGLVSVIIKSFKFMLSGRKVRLNLAQKLHNSMVLNVSPE